MQESSIAVAPNQCKYHQVRTARDKRSAITYFCILEKHTQDTPHKFNEEHSLEADLSQLFK